jgi:nucleoside-diphosphate-sugar epimerase
MRVLITGAEGFTGRHLCSHLHQHGHEPVGITGDLTEPVVVSTAIARALGKTATPYSVIHLAAIAHVAHQNASDFYRVNVIGTTHLLRALADQAHAPTSVVLASSANIYGNCTALPITENTPAAPVNHYAMSKLSMEIMARSAGGPGQGLPITITRPFNYTGEGQDSSYIIPKLVYHFANRLPEIALGNLDVKREYNDIRTICESYRHLIEAGPVSTIFNLCSGITYSIREVIAMLTEITGHHLTIRFDPTLARRNEVSTLYGSPDRFDQWLSTVDRKLQRGSLHGLLARLVNQPTPRNECH